jgi:hypothetical protein
LQVEELQVLERRLRAEKDHHANQSRNRCKELEANVSRLQEQLQLERGRNKELDEEFARYRAAQRSTPEAKLRTDVARLMGEQRELEAALQVGHSMYSIVYSSRVFTCASHVQRERETRQQEARLKDDYCAKMELLARILRKERKQRAERAGDQLEQLRLQYLAREERFVLDGDRNELQSIKKELDGLRDHMSRDHMSRDHVTGGAPQGFRAQVPPAAQQQQPPLQPLPEQPEEEDDDSMQPLDPLSRLVKEREQLLLTPGYTGEHKLIRELTRRIQLEREAKGDTAPP